MFLSDMQIFCDKILRYTNGLNQQAFFANDVVLDAFLRNLELLGEASKQIPAEVRQLNLAHAYFGLEEDTIWQIIQTSIPDLQSKLFNLKSP